MIGHGRPSSLAIFAARKACAGWLALAAAVTLAMCVVITVPAAAQDIPSDDPLRLRIAWGGSEASRWFGRLWIENGSLSNLKLLGLSADSAGSIWLQDGAVQVATLSARKHDVIEVAAVARHDSKLLFELSTEERGTSAQVTVSLAELRRRPYLRNLDDRGNTLQVELVPANALRITTDREPLFFAPGEQFSFELKPMLPDIVPGTTLDIRGTLSAARREEALWSNEQRLAVPVDGQPNVTLNVPLPRSEGVYTVRVTASRPSGFRVGFFSGAAAPLAERTVDLVVLDSRAAPGTSVLTSAVAQASPWETVLEIDPASARWWDRLPGWTQVRRIPGLNRGPLGSIRAGAVDLPLGRFVELPPTVGGADPHWQAYSLPLEVVGEPHVLEIEYPADAEQHFGISIVEPNSAGVVEGIGRDAGVYVEGFGRSEAKERHVHRVIFWPRTQAPLLLMTNSHPTAPTHFGHIRVLKRKTDHSAGTPPGPPPAKRWVAAYLARPLVAESMGATEGIGSAPGSIASTSRTVDDWQTFYESATRLVDYLRYGGYNCAVISVLADGSSIYPSARLMPTPLYNTGRAASEPNEIDGLELLLRVFDREGLALVPALQFATPLPELEALRRGSDPQTSGLEWVGADGRTWLATHGAANGLAPYYNLLEPRVQQAILRVASELVERYGQHRAFGGLALQLSAKGFAQLPPLEWGFDDATMARFARDTGIELTATGPERFAARHAAMSGEHADAWREWRAARVTDFYAQLAAVVRESNNDRRLLLTLEESLDHPRLAARIRPNLLMESRVERMLVELGIHRQLLEKAPGIVLCPTRYVESTALLSDRAVDLELNKATAGWQHLKSNPGATPAALLYHRPQRRRLTSFEVKSPFAMDGNAALVAQPLAHGNAVRQPYVEVLLNNDPSVLLDGGELLPLGQEDVLRQVRSIVRQLPATAEVHDTVKQPVVVRSYSESDRVTLLVLNASPWRADAGVTLELTQATTLEPLVPVQGENIAVTPPRSLSAGKQSWPLSLEPYAVQAFVIETPGVKVIEVRAEASGAAKAELAARLADLANRDLTAPRVFRALVNPSFEPIGGAAPLPGWRLLSNAGTATAELDAVSPQHGKTSLYIDCRGDLAAVESEAFAMPPTGQLAMTVFVRGQNIGPQTSLRMVFESDRGGNVYRRFAPLATQQLGNEWRPYPYAILVNDLPLESGGQMRVRFEISGPGEIWFDNVTMYDLLFPLRWYPNARAEIVQLLKVIHAAKSAFEAGQVADCVRLLEGYWPRFVATYTPLVQPALAVQPAPVASPPSSPPADQNQQPTPGISDRIKRIVPFVR